MISIETIYSERRKSNQISAFTLSNTFLLVYASPCFPDGINY